MKMSPLTRVVLVIALQVAILLSVIGFRQYTQWTAETVLLRVDSGNPQTLTSGFVEYDISTIDLAELPGDDEFIDNIYVELRRQGDGFWTAVAVHDDRERSFDGTVLIKGEIRGVEGPGRLARYLLRYDIENVSATAAARAGLPSGSDHSIGVEVDVDRFGNATAQHFVIDGTNFDLSSR